MIPVSPIYIPLYNTISMPYINYESLLEEFKYFEPITEPLLIEGQEYELD
jgi:hypothetical protein